MTDTPPLVVTLVPELGGLAREWDDLLEHKVRSTPFLRSWWLRSVRTDAGAHLLVRTADGTLVGGLPLESDRLLGVRRIRLTGSGVLCPDHLDLVAHPHHERAVGAATVRSLTSGPRGLLELTGLVQDSLLARSFGRAAEVVDVAPYAVLPAAADDYLATRSSGTRRSVRRSDRRLAGLGAVHRRVTAATLPAAIRDFRLLHEARPDRAPLLAELPVLGRAFAAGLAAGQARVDVLETGGRAQAVSLAFVVGDRLSLYQVARSVARADDGAGTVLLHRVIADAVAAGCREIDLLRGDEAYKDALADDRRTIGRLRLARGPAAAAVLGGRRLAAAARRRAVRSV